MGVGCRSARWHKGVTARGQRRSEPFRCSENGDPSWRSKEPPISIRSIRTPVAERAMSANPPEFLRARLALRFRFLPGADYRRRQGFRVCSFARAFAQLGPLRRASIVARTVWFSENSRSACPRNQRCADAAYLGNPSRTTSSSRLAAGIADRVWYNARPRFRSHGARRCYRP